MDYITLGTTGIKVNKNGFGALPIQRAGEDVAVVILKKAYDNGINFFDTARLYSDSEKKIGIALSTVRDKIIIASKTMSTTTEVFWAQLETSLEMLNTDYIDLYQFHNPPACYKPGDKYGLYDAMLEAKAQGKVRHIGITTHKLDTAREAMESGLYETIQYPFSYLATDKEIEFVRQCAQRNIPIIAMKALSGGLITNSAAAYAFLSQFENVLPIWGIQRENELDEFLSYQDNPPSLDDEMLDTINRDKTMLAHDFCRGCGYCLPCPAEIDIPTSARMSLLIRRAPTASYLTPEWKDRMNRIENCIDCGHCKAHCPYGLDTPELLRTNLKDYLTFL